MLAFSPDDEEVDHAYNAFGHAHPSVSLSHMQDAYTRSIMLSYALEIKEPSGDQGEAAIQLAVFQSASLAKLHELVTDRFGDPDEEDSQQELPALLGWTIIGHEWKSFITYATQDSIVSTSHNIPERSVLTDIPKTQVCQGPFDHLVAGTGSLRSTFMLFDLIKRACDTLENGLWPFCRSVLLQV